MNAEFFLNKIKEEFPELVWKKYRYVSHGYDHDVVILDDKVVFRFPKSKEYENSLYNETKLLSYLKKKIHTGIPDYFLISKNKSLAGYKFLDGRELNFSLFKRLGSTEKDDIAQQIAGFLTNLHTIPKSIAKKYKVTTDDAAKSYNRLVNDTEKYLFPRLNKKEILLVTEYFKELKIALDFKHADVLIHKDLTWEHIFWDSKKKKVNIIDFSDRSFGDPASDFTGLWEYGLKFVNQIYDLYQGKKDEKMLYRSQLYLKKTPLSAKIIYVIPLRRLQSDVGAPT